MFTHTNAQLYMTHKERMNPLTLIMFCSANVVTAPKLKLYNGGARKWEKCDNLCYQTADFTTNKPSIIPFIKKHFAALIDVPSPSESRL